MRRKRGPVEREDRLQKSFPRFRFARGIEPFRGMSVVKNRQRKRARSVSCLDSPTPVVDKKGNKTPPTTTLQHGRPKMARVQNGRKNKRRGLPNVRGMIVDLYARARITIRVNGTGCSSGVCIILAVR